MAAESIAKALGGRKSGGEWNARCPAHQDRTPSLSIRDANDGKVLVCCHAGCTQDSVITALRARGLWEDGSPRNPGVSTMSRKSQIVKTHNALTVHSRSGNRQNRPAVPLLKPISAHAVFICRGHRPSAFARD
jgi:hypothetical protein